MSKRLSWYVGLTALLAAVTLGAQAQPLTGGLLGRSSSGSSTPATCVTAGQVPFLGSPTSLGLGCDAGLTYDAATDTLTVGGAVNSGVLFVRPSIGGLAAIVGNSLGTFQVVSGGKFAFVSSATDADMAADTGLIRVSAGLVGVTSGGSNLGSLQAGNYTATALGTPGLITITNEGTAGATANSYSVIAYLNDGTHTSYGPASTSATSNATLDGTNFNRLTWSAVTNAAYYAVWRFASGGTPASVGKIWSGTALTLDDTGLAGDAAPIPDTNTTGRVLAWTGGRAAPSYSFSTYPSTGMYARTPIDLDFSVNDSFAFGMFDGGFRFGPNLTVFATAPASDTFQHGNKPSIAPTAQTLIVGESGAGTDIAGANGVIQSPPGTGSGIGSTLALRTPVAHGSDAVAQTMVTRMVLSSSGVNVPGLATYADNAAALTGGLVAGDLYRTSTGVLMVTY